MRLDPSEEIIVAGGKMKEVSEAIGPPLPFTGSLSNALKRLAGGTSLFLSRYKCSPGSPGDIAVGVAEPGDVYVIQDVAKEPVIIFPQSFLASANSVRLESIWAGFASLLTLPSSFLIRATGSGPLILGGDGPIDREGLQSGKKLTVNNSLVVAFSADIKHKITTPGGAVTSILSEQGFMIEFTGPGFVIRHAGSET